MLEVYADNGRACITKPRVKTGDVGTVKAFAKGGEAKLVKLEANELESIWKVNIKK